MIKNNSQLSSPNHDSRLKPITVAVLAALAAVPAVASANQFGDSLGSAFHVDTNTTSATPGAWRIASDATGDFVVAWDDGRTGTDTVYARLYAADGTPVTSDFVVSTSTATSIQRDAAVAMDAAGDFVVTWDSQNGGSEYQVYARRYAKDGTPIDASEFLVSSITTANQQRPAVAMDAAGDFVVVWSNYATTTIQARTYTADGTAGTEFQVNSTTTSVKQPAVAMDAAGDFVVSYYNKYYGGSTIAHAYVRQYSAGAATAGTEMQIDTNTSTSSVVMGEQVAMDAQGDFVVAWGQGKYPILETVAQRFNPDGTTNGAEIILPAAGLPTFSPVTGVSMDAEGDFIVGWGEYNKYTSTYAAKIQAYTKDGNPTRNAVTLDESTSAFSGIPSVAMDAAGDVVATWMEYVSGSGNNYPIMAQRFAGQGVDLATSISADSGSVPTGNYVTLTLGVANASASFATGIAAFDDVAGSASGTSLDLVIPSGMSFKSATGTNWTCATPANGVLSCNYSALIAPQTSAEPLSIRLATPVAASGAGAAAFLTAVTAQQADPDLSNNYAATAVTITAAKSSSGSTTTSSSSGGGAFGWLTLGIFSLLGWRRRRITRG